MCRRCGAGDPSMHPRSSISAQSLTLGAQRCDRSPDPRSPARPRGRRTRTPRSSAGSLGCASLRARPMETRPHGRISHSKFCVPPCARTCRNPLGDEGRPSRMPKGRSAPGYAGYRAGRLQGGPVDPPVPAPAYTCASASAPALHGRRRLLLRYGAARRASQVRVEDLSHANEDEAPDRQARRPLARHPRSL